METLQIRKKDEYNNQVLDKIDFMSISHKYRIVGSASIRNILYSSDYDTNEQVFNPKNSKSQSLEYIYEMFLKKFQYASKRENRTYIIDFKCGIDDEGKALRWNYEDMKKGYKIVKGVQYDFLTSILQPPPNMVKIDVISFLNGRYIEMSDIYNIKIGNEKNFKLQTKEDIQKNIMNEAEELIKEGNYYKALKRIFSNRKIGSNNTIDKKIEKIIDFLNSDIGIIGKSKSDLDVLIDLLEKYPKQIYADDIYSNLQIIKQFLSSVTKYNMRPIIEKINRTQKLSTIKDIREDLHKLTNQQALIFMKNNSLI
jgi:hypothetical protein